MASIEKIKELRESLQASVTDCKKALEETDGDIEEAKEKLREMGMEEAETKQEERSAREGVVGSYIHSDKKVAALVKLYCQSDFTARTDEFQELAHAVAMQVAGLDPEDKEDLMEKPYIKDEEKTTKELITDQISKTGEKIEVGEFVRFEI